MPETAEGLQCAEQQGMAPADLGLAERAVLSYLRLCDAEELKNVAELEGGLGNRLVDMAKQATTLDELLSLASTKKYPNSRLRRGLLFAMTGVTKEDLKESPSYVRVLAANSKGCAILASNRRDPAIAAVTRQAELPSDGHAMRQEQLHAKAVSLYTLCLKKPVDARSLLRRNPTILK